MRSLVAAGAVSVALLGTSPVLTGLSPALAETSVLRSTDGLSLPASIKEAKEMSKRNSRVTGDAANLFNLAKKMAEIGNYNEALNRYNELIESTPNFAGGYSNRANLKVAKKEYESALTDYGRAIELAPLASDTWVVYLNRGCVYEELNRQDEALQDFNRALELKSDEPLILANRAAVYSSRSKWEMALNDFRRAVEKKPNDVQPYWLNYCLTLYQRGNTTEALSILRRVAAKFPNEPLVRASLAVILFDKGEIADAETNWSLIDRPRPLLSKKFLQEHHWPPKAIDAMMRFKELKE